MKLTHPHLQAHAHMQSISLSTHTSSQLEEGKSLKRFVTSKRRRQAILPCTCSNVSTGKSIVTSEKDSIMVFFLEIFTMYLLNRKAKVCYYFRLRYMWNKKYRKTFGPSNVYTYVHWTNVPEAKRSINSNSTTTQYNTIRCKYWMVYIMHFDNALQDIRYHMWVLHGKQVSCVV